MWASILSILAYLVPFVLDAWQASRPEAKKEARNDEIQKGRLAIASGDVAYNNSRIDRLLSDGGMPTEARTLPGSASGLYGDASIAKRLNDLLKP